jgi:prepilin signal peptidase PulO-like enzyme (type II secretory pathway)
MALSLGCCVWGFLGAQLGVTGEPADGLSLLVGRAPIRAILIASLSGVGLGYALARFTDGLWPRSLSNDPHTEVRELVPLISFGLAVMFPVQYQQHGMTIVFLKNCIFAAAMFLVERINRRSMLVPNIITIAGTVLGLFLSVFTPPGAASAIVGTLAGGGALFLIAELYYRSTGREGLGMGIVKLQALVGAFLGWQLAAVAFTLGTIAAAVVGLIDAARRNDAEQRSIPFGSYLALSAVIAASFGQGILDWYLSHFR